MIKNEIKILDDISHVKLRKGMYIGATSTEEREQFLFGTYQKIKYVPGLVKIIEELINNCTDEAIRTNFKFANKISVSIDQETSTIVVEDNGRGLPQNMVNTPEGTEIPAAVAAWTRVKAGSNFDDSQGFAGAGQNGVGASLTNIFSKSFIGITCDGDNTMTIKCENNLSSIDWKVKSGGKQGTKVTVVPDFEHFECKAIDDIVLSIFKDQLQTLAVTFPEIQFKFNNERIQGNFKKYAKQFDENAIVMETDNIQFAIGSSADGFRHLSYINSIHTKVGGTHIDYVIEELVNELMPAIKRKYKVDVNKARIKECITLLLFVKGFPNARFDSQTKERLTSPWGEIKAHIDLDIKKLARMFINTEEILMPIIESVLARKLAAEKAANTLAAKKAAKAKVAKHIKANMYGKDADTTLFLTEGDCFDENEMIYTLDGNVSGKDIQVGDTVMTRSHNFKKVTAKTIRLKEGVLVNGKILSADHKLYVYDIGNGAVDYIKASDLDKNRHKLIKNRLVSLGGPIDRQRKILNLDPSGMRVQSSDGTEHYVKSSQSHEFLVLTDGGLVLKPFKNLSYGDVVVL